MRSLGFKYLLLNCNPMARLLSTWYANFLGICCEMMKIGAREYS
jgi:hypothetical protein